MVFSESLASRIRDALIGMRGIQEKRMFGGVGFLLNGNMLVGVWQESLIARLGPEAGDKALLEPHVREFDITGRPMKGWVLVDPDGTDREEQLRCWIERAITFVTTLPAKTKEDQRTASIGRSAPPPRSAGR